jgi:hypothetical protein
LLYLCLVARNEIIPNPSAPLVKMPVIGIDGEKRVLCSADFVKPYTVIGDVLQSLGRKVGVNIVKRGVKKADYGPIMELGVVQVKLLIESLVLLRLKQMTS